MFRVADIKEIQEAAERLCALVSAVDLADTLPATAKDLVALGERIERSGHGLKLLAAAKVASTEVWRGEGARTAEEWLAGRTGTTPQAARRELDTARRLERLPATAAAVQQGELSSDQATAIADAASVDPSAEGGLLSSAGRSSLRDLKDRCARTKANADPDPEATAARIRARRAKRCWTDPEGVGHLHLSGPAAVIARMDNAISHRADRLFRDARKDGRREAPEAYAFDAAEQLLTRRGDGADVPAGADAKIIVRVDHGALQRGHAIDGEVCEIAGRGPIDVGTAREWLEDAFVAALATDGVDVTKVVHLGRRFTALQRTVLQWQDPVCARRGCNNRLGLEYDHFEDWADTRTTRTGSAKRFCQACHRLKTIGWHVSPPGPDGQCDFSEPARDDDLSRLAESCATAIASRRRQHAPRARSDPDPPALFDPA